MSARSKHHKVLLIRPDWVDTEQSKSNCRSFDSLRFAQDDSSQVMQSFGAGSIILSGLRERGLLPAAPELKNPGSVMERAAVYCRRLMAGALTLRRKSLVACVLCAASAISASAKSGQVGIIRPGEVWVDDRGEEIQAHGGAILQVKNMYYWIGEDRSKSNAPDKRYISCYSSTDLVHWSFRNHLLELTDPEGLGAGWILERPKVFYNAKTKKYVLYAHIDKSDYSYARVAVAVSDRVDGHYQFVRSFRPLGKESRDIGGFVDDDGKSYLIFESRPSGGFYIASLTEDYMGIEKEVSFIHVPLEGGAIVHYDGLYYAIGSYLTGWNPNPNVYATAPRLDGPWTPMHDVAPPETKTYDSQSGMLIKVVGRKGTSVIYAGDRWKPHALWDSRYVWLPVEIGGGRFVLSKPQAWSIDIKNGLILPVAATPSQ